jgi:hypothetical protein
MPHRRGLTVLPFPALAKAFELSLAAPQVIALRTMMLLSPANTGTAQEVIRMSAEKLQAWQESMTAMGVQMQRAQQEWALGMMRHWWSAWSTPWRPPLAAPGADAAQLQRAVSRVMHSGLAPVHRRATANARRLTRRKH